MLHFQSVYDAEFEFLSVTLVVEALVVQMYINPKVFDMLSLETCVCHDICMAKGGTEAVVESFYSLITAQANNTLALRTKLEWVVPPFIKASKFVSGTAKIYLNGDKEFLLKPHQWSTINR